MKATLDTTHHGVSATVLSAGTGRYTLAVRAVEAAAWIEVDLTAEGIGVLVAALLEHFDRDALRAVIASHLGAERAALAAVVRAEPAPKLEAER